METASDLRLRAWTRSDLAAMADVINARVAVEGEGEHATVASLAEQYEHLVRCDPATDIVVATSDDEQIVGYSRVGWNDVSEGYRQYWVVYEGLSTVDGALSTTFDWGVARAAAIAATHDHPDKRIITWAADGSADQLLIAATGGFTPVAWSAHMVRPHLHDIPDRPLPDGLETRPVESDQLRAIWEADIEAFRDHRGYVEQTETDWERFVDEAAQGTELWQVAWDGDRVAGQVRTRVNDGEAERLGRRRAWTEDISTRREWRGQGVASALLAASLEQLASHGYDEAALGVDLDNPTGALDLYARMGYAVVQRHTEYEQRL